MLVRLNPTPNPWCVWTPTKPLPSWEHNPTYVDAKGRVRPPPGETPHDHFHCQYNEIVTDAVRVNAAMPSLVEAFFYPTNCWQSPRAHLNTIGPTNATQVRAVYERFRSAYGGGATAAFLAFDCARLARGEPPFVDA